MKKNLITAAILSCTAMTSFTALADGPNFYGRADLALTNSDMGAATQNKKDGLVLENNFSWLGVKGTEKINDNFAIIYQMEFGVSNFDNSDNTFAARNSFVGLQTNGGTVLVGRNDTVFKSAEGGFDLFGNTNADIDLLTAGQERRGDGVSYYSPVMANMLAVNATYLVDDNYDTVSDSMYAVSATMGDKALKSHNFYAAAAYQDGINDVEAYRGVIQAKFGNFIVGGLYQNSESLKEELAHLKGDTYYVNLAYVMGDVKLKATYGHDDSGLGKIVNTRTGQVMSQDDTDSVSAMDARKDVTDVDIQQFSVGADYRMSTNTLVYGQYTRYNGDMKLNGAVEDLSDDIFTVGVRLDF
ncbi:porin [Shewanella olleyana]|uniref:porin n=1 Tax=Shewanella olleyana TaxID=135626 RepID=UPI002010C40F|nr:porin [Shewanella olleyana]MCL1067444.1 porin [Shewanella olleyana]